MILPWRHGHSHNRDMGEVAADQASAVAVLHGLHALADLTDQEVEVMQADSSLFVVARTDIPENKLALPPCIPRTSNVYDKAEHPLAVRIRVQVTEPPQKDDQEGQPEDTEGE